MNRSLLTVALVLCLAGAACAIDYSAQLEREYTDRLLTMEDTAAAHVELATWCDGVGLAKRAKTHWQQALLRDADNKAARKALGYVRRNMKWIRAEDAPSLPPLAVGAGAAAPKDPTFEQRRRRFSREIQDVSVKYLSSLGPGAWDEGVRKILMIRDPAAAEPIARILGSGNVEMRKLACETLGQLPGEDAARRLVKIALADKSVDVYKAAVAALEARVEDRGLRQLLNALNGSEKVLHRSAYALGEMREWRAVPSLIGKLRTSEPRVRTYEAPRSGAIPPGPSAYFFFGTIVTYIADVEPVVAEGAVGWDPTIGAIPVGTMIAAHNPRVIIHRTVIVFVYQPVVREALKKITGQDFEFNSQAWRDWLRRRESDHGAAVAPLGGSRGGGSGAVN